MKKIFLTLSVTAIIVFAGTVLSCNKDMTNDELPIIKDVKVNEFIHSVTFERHYVNIKSYGNIDFENIFVDSMIVANKVVNYFVIPIMKNRNRAGFLEVIDMHGTTYLPNGDQYALNYVDWNNFNTETRTGSIKMIDMNYDNHIHSTMQIASNTITSRKFDGLSTELKIKYKDYKTPARETDIHLTELTDDTEQCDKNGNNNISFSECYKCLNDAIDKNGTSKFICDFPFIGWASCWISVSVSCLIIAAIY